jgi:2-oxoglutarate dehydrogenase E1 component
LPYKQLDAIRTKYSAANWYWVQEEPLNMGAASFLQMNLTSFNYKIISRSASASTATGYSKVHAKEQAQIIDQAFSI